MMYKNITVNPISRLQGNMLFVTLIFEKYSFKTSAGKSPLLYYLRNRRDDRFLSNFYLSIFHKYSKDLTTVQNVLEQKNTIINRNSLHEKNIEQENEKVTNFYHKNVLNQKNPRQENPKPINFYDKDLIHTTNPFNQNILNEVNLRQKNQLSTNFYHENLMDTNIRHTTNEIFLYKTTTPPRNNIHTVVPLEHQKNIQNTIQNKQESIVNNSALIYDSSQNILSLQKISKDVSETKVIKHSSNDQMIEVEKMYPAIEQVDIKKLTDKIFPMIMKRWQKEFERRGVFYG